MNPPRITRPELERLALPIWRQENPTAPLPVVYFVMVRGYRFKTMGNPERNDVGVNDDAGFLLTPTLFMAENMNTDPSRLGWNQGVGKPYGMLKSNRVWWFYPGAHKGRTPAFRQADDASVARMFDIPHDGKFLVTRMWGYDDKRNYEEWGHQQVNIHQQSVSSTSSWLCLTVPIDRYEAFLGTAVNELRRYALKKIPVILIEGPVN